MSSSVNVQAVAAEFIATTLFVWTGTGTVVSAVYIGGDFGDASVLVAAALGFGIAIASLAYSVGHISGGHINPAVTFAFMLMKELDAVSGLLYMLAQFLGAVFGSLLLWGCVASMTDNCEEGSKYRMTSGGNFLCENSMKSGGGYGAPFNLASNGVNPNVTLGSAFLIELMGTLLLVFVVLHSAVHSESGAGNAAPIAIGWAVLLAHLVLVPFTGCGINPARTFGPMLVASFSGLNNWKRGWWVYYTAPFVGSAIATGIYKFVLQPQDDDDEEDGEDKGDEEKGDEEQAKRI